MDLSEKVFIVRYADYTVDSVALLVHEQQWLEEELKGSKATYVALKGNKILNLRANSLPRGGRYYEEL